MSYDNLEDTVYCAAHILVELVRRCEPQERFALSMLRADPQARLPWAEELDAKGIRDIARSVLEESGQALPEGTEPITLSDVDPLLRTASELLEKVLVSYPPAELLQLAKVQAGLATVGGGARLSSLEAQAVRAAAHRIFAGDLRDSEMKEAWAVLELARIIRDYGFTAPDGTSTEDLLASPRRKRDYRDIALDRILFELVGPNSSASSIDQLLARYEHVPMLGLVLRPWEGKKWYVELTDE